MNLIYAVVYRLYALMEGKNRDCGSGEGGFMTGRTGENWWDMS
jgi:hypothetical protein